MKYLPFIFLLFACSLSGPTDEARIKNESKEIKRITSPDQKVDAVLLERNGGATSSITNHVFLVPKGKAVEGLQYAILTADNFLDLDISWQANQTLMVGYDKARIFKFYNSWNSDLVDNWKYIVEIKLQCTSDSQLFKEDKYPSY
jgi:hypothetical protein